MVKPVSTKNIKISWAWWWAPVIQATQEAKAGELLEPGRHRLQWAKIVPLHSSLGNKSETPSQKEKKKSGILLSVVAHACNPSTLGGGGGRITWGQELETGLANMVKPVSTKNIKVSWAWWCMPMIPATRESEAQESFELRRWRLQWAETGATALQRGQQSETLSQKKFYRL